MENDFKSYSQLLTELKAKGISPQEKNADFYEFEGFPMEEEFLKFYEFGQKYLERKDIGFNFNFPGLYFNTSTSSNALAYNIEDACLIEIFKGSLFYLHGLFNAKSELFDLPEYTAHKAAIEKRGVNCGFFLFQYVMLFFLYHETGHLIQRSETEGHYLEYMKHKCEGGEVPIRHMRELDADWHGAHCLAMHLLEFAGTEGKAINNEELTLIASMALGAIYTFFINSAHVHSVLYYEEHCHPHPSVRLAYTIRFLLDNLKGNTEHLIDEGEVLKNAVKVSEALLKTADSNIVEDYSIQLWESLNQVEEYIKEIIGNTDSYPHLCIHKIQKYKQAQSE